MNDNRFMLACVISIICGILAVIISVQLLNIRKNELKVEMVRAGASAAEASCSVDHSYNNCLIAAKEKSNER